MDTPFSVIRNTVRCSSREVTAGPTLAGSSAGTLGRCGRAIAGFASKRLSPYAGLLVGQFGASG